MLNKKQEAKGIDVYLNMIQESIYNDLTTTYNWQNYESYSRVSKNFRDDKIVPEIDLGNFEFIDVLMDDKFNATSFFVCSNEREIESSFMARQKVSMIFQADLKLLYPTRVFKSDEKLINDVLNAFGKMSNYELNKVVTGYQNVYSQFEFREWASTVKFTDFGNKFVARFDFDLSYQASC